MQLSNPTTDTAQDLFFVTDPTGSWGDCRPTITTEERQGKAHYLALKQPWSTHTKVHTHKKGVTSKTACGTVVGVLALILPSLPAGVLSVSHLGPESHSDFSTSIAMFIPSMLHISCLYLTPWSLQHKPYSSMHYYQPTYTVNQVVTPFVVVFLNPQQVSFEKNSADMPFILVTGNIIFL